MRKYVNAQAAYARHMFNKVNENSIRTTMQGKSEQYINETIKNAHAYYKKRAKELYFYLGNT